MNVDLYYNQEHTAYAVLVSRGYGAAWSYDYGKELAYDKRVIEWYLEHENEEFWNKIHHFDSAEYQEAREFFATLGYEYIYFGGLHSGMLEWMPLGTIWRINEYDGNEAIEYFSLDNWICFK